ncbi:hypothetical protein BTO30_14845 [Domibacillus antri]|uniref:SH3b domain-containing protein n=1 Tax=Domibacillus antri TaxID=1714264 RepID=A0A1Q8Q261_9BACI|nr:phage tail protein [Domibacillus antri]OLN21395.1 hypothetical protein BTO30_14845 [Domibacillus antri]
MGVIGSFLGVVFEVSSAKVLTLDDFERFGSANWQEHKIVSRKSILEFMGADLEKIKFIIRLSASLGANPSAEILRLRRAKNDGITSKFIMSNASISASNWAIDEINEIYRIRDNEGRLISADIELLLIEYPILYKPPQKVKASSIKSKPTNASKKGAIGKVTIKAPLNLRSGPSLKSKIVRVLRKGQSYKVYGSKKTDITWYALGGGVYCSANTKYVKFEKV